MDNLTTVSRPPQRAIHLGLLILVCLGAFWLRTEGIDWPKFHPDEYPIADWIEQTATRGYFTDKVYAGGFFTLARPVQKIVRAVHGRAHAFAFHRGATDLPENEPFDPILFARWFNVWLAVLTCLLFYGLARRVSNSSTAGVLAAALFAFAQYPVEHSHYGETDPAMLCMLTLACWLWIIAIGNRRLLAFGAAALVSGFAAGTKFPLMILLPLVPIVGLLRIDRPVTKKTCLNALGYAGFGLGVFALGFVLANPRMVMDWSGFQAGLAWETRRVYGETALNMGPLLHHPFARYGHNILALGRCFLTLGWGWIGLALAGVFFACLKEYRRFWPILLLFPALYTFYWIFFAPWVRSQEFMNYLPAVSVLAILPLVSLWRTQRPLFRTAAIVLAGLALALNADNGLRTAALFGWTDTRFLARQWMEQRFPDTARLAAEPYAAQACPKCIQAPIPISGKLERRGITPLKEQGVDFVLLAANNTGRGLMHPITGQRYPGAQRLFDEFCDQSERLATWGPLTRRSLATFISPTIELWGLKRFTPTRNLTLELPQPLLIDNIYHHRTLRPTFFPDGHKLGGATGLLIDQRPRVLAMGGTQGRSDPAYLVLNTEERGTVVHLRGRVRRTRVTLAPYSVAIVPLNRFYWPGRGMPFERITLAAAPKADVIYLPCYARVAYGPAEVARMCADLGQPDVPWTLFSDDQLTEMQDPVQRYLLAVRSERWDLADRWESAAVQTAASLSSAGPDPALSANVAIHGTSGYYHDALARIRLQDRGLYPTYHDEFSWGAFLNNSKRNLMCLEVSFAGQPDGQVIENTLALPIRLARGRYKLSGELWVKPDPALTHPPADLEYTLNQRRTWTRYPSAPAPSGWTPFSALLSADQEMQPSITVRSKWPVKLYFQNLTLRWSLASALDFLDRSLRIARTAHALHRDQYAAALELLEKMDASGELPDALEIRQLKFQALLGLPDRDASRLAVAARDVLALAPATYACLRALADDDPAARAGADSLRANLKQPLACGPFLSLIGYAFNPTRAELSCVFEILKNNTPPLAVTLHVRHHSEWRKRQREPLSDRPQLQRGERVALHIRLNTEVGNTSAENIALGIESSVQWHPSAIPIAGRRGNVIPLDVIGVNIQPGFSHSFHHKTSIVP